MPTRNDICRTYNTYSTYNAYSIYTTGQLGRTHGSTDQEAHEIENPNPNADELFA